MQNRNTLVYSYNANTRTLWGHAKKGHYGVLVLQTQGHCGGMQNRDTMGTCTANTRKLLWHAKNGHYGVLVLQIQGHYGGMQKRDTMVYSYCKHKYTVVACKKGTAWSNVNIRTL
jgi:adenylate kinase